MTDCEWGFDLYLLQVIYIWFFAIRITFMPAQNTNPGLQVMMHKEYLEFLGANTKNAKGPKEILPATQNVFVQLL